MHKLSLQNSAPAKWNDAPLAYSLQAYEAQNNIAENGVSQYNPTPGIDTEPINQYINSADWRDPSLHACFLGSRALLPSFSLVVAIAAAAVVINVKKQLGILFGASSRRLSMI